MNKLPKKLFLGLVVFCLGLLPLAGVQAGLVLSDPDYSKQWYLPQIQAPSAWEETTGSPKVVVAVIDTGADIDHPDLKSNIWVNDDEVPDDKIDNDQNGYIDDVNGWNFVENNNDPRPYLSDGFSVDAVNHGTLISGIIAAQTNNGLGIAGISWQSKIMPLRAIDSFGAGSTTTVANAIDYAVANGADIINLSFVSSKDNDFFHQAIIRAYEQGVIIVAASGNEPEHAQGDDLSKVKMYPACYDEVLTVAATDTIDQRAYFSNYGKDCVDLSAPGVGVYGALYYNPTLVLGFFNNQKQFTEYYGGSYDGTSFSAPMVAGATALIKSARPNLTNRQIYDLLIESADPIDSLNPNYQGMMGSGRLDIAKALLTSVSQSAGTATSQYFANQSLLLASVMGAGPAQIYLLGKDKVVNQFLAGMETTANGLFLANGDIDMDGLTDIVAGPSQGLPPEIKVFDQSGNLKALFLAYDQSFKGGVNVAVGDVDNDSEPEIITAPASGSAPWVKVFSRTGVLKYQVLAYDEAFISGVNLAIGDIDNDRYDEIITASRDQNKPIKVFNYHGSLKSEFVGYNHNYRGGVNVAVGDVNEDGVAEIVTAPMTGGGPHIRIFEYTGLVLGQFFAYKETFIGGVSLAIVDLDADGQKEIVTAPGPTGGPHIRAFGKAGNLKLEYFAFDAQMTKGLRIANN